MLGHDLVLAVLEGLPIQLARAQTVNTVFFRGLQVVIDFGVKQQRFGRDAAHVQACASQLVVFLDQAGLQPKLSGTESGGVSARPSADNGNVIDDLWHGSTPLMRKHEEPNI